MADISTAIRETTALFKRRSTPEDWAQNIIDGSRSVKTPEDWTHYYAWLANPSNYNPQKKLRVAEIVDIKPYPPGFEEVRYPNGPDVVIHVKNTRVQEEVEDEKSPAE